MKNPSVFIAQNLDLNMPRLLDIFLDINIGIAEIRLSLSLGSHQPRSQTDVIVANPHTFTAASGSSLDDNRITYALGNFYRLILILYGGQTPGHYRDSAFTHGLAGLHFITHKTDIFRGRPDKGYPAGFADFGKMGILGQEAVTRMYGIHIGYLGG